MNFWFQHAQISQSKTKIELTLEEEKRKLTLTVNFLVDQFACRRKTIYAVDFETLSNPFRTGSFKEMMMMHALVGRLCDCFLLLFE